MRRKYQAWAIPQKAKAERAYMARLIRERRGDAQIVDAANGIPRMASRTHFGGSCSLQLTLRQTLSPRLQSSTDRVQAAAMKSMSRGQFIPCIINSSSHLPYDVYSLAARDRLGGSLTGGLVALRYPAACERIYSGTSGLLCNHSKPIDYSSQRAKLTTAGSSVTFTYDAKSSKYPWRACQYH